MDFDRPLDPPDDSIYVIYYRIFCLDGRTLADSYRTERDALDDIEVLIASRLAKYRLLREAEADEEALEADELVRAFTDEELLADLRGEYEVIEDEEEEEEDGDWDDWRYGP